MVKRLCSPWCARLIAMAVAVCFARAGHAEGANDVPRPVLHHVPVAVAPAGQDLTLLADIDHPELVRAAFAVYRASGGAYRESRFLRAAEGPYVAIIPASEVQTPSFGYAIELEPLGGGRVAAFSARDDLQEVSVRPDLDDARERTVLQRLGGRRSMVSSSAQYVVFGERAQQGDRVVGDRYWQTEAAYVYRPLRLVSEFGIRVGVVRGPNPDPDPKKPDLGLNYGAPHVRLRLADAWHVQAEFLTSITEVGFSVGTGAALLIGDPYGSKLTLGFQSVQVFGSRVYSRLDLVAGRRLMIAPMVEVTNMPHADRFGVRLLTEARVDVGQGWGAGLLLGYQARLATGGGPTVGLDVGYAF